MAGTIARALGCAALGAPFLLAAYPVFIDEAARNGQLGYTLSVKGSLGGEQGATAAFWIAKVLELVGAILLMAAPLLSAASVFPTTRGAEKLGAQLLLAFLIPVTVLLHGTDYSTEPVKRNVAYAGALLAIVFKAASSEAKSGKGAKRS